ncbi:HNH endonuclease [Puerhibacterium puerhi]|uniref:HNH endonuclease n=1 Tax=Puerhibacterium puerhi TaxID=2692623 RepID=UPI001358B024|nr:HNH endonuclease signature motif containing protein [Puerhibacterium puerhi]
MPGWTNSNRRDRLPKDWQAIRHRVFRRDGGRCCIPLPDGRRCPNAATQVDHIIPGDDHSLDNLQSICDDHHRVKSSSEGARALNAKKAQNAKKFLRPERHPGLL